MVFAKNSEPSLYFLLQPSRLLVRCLVVTHGLALAASLLNGLPVMLRVAIFLCVLVHGVWLSKTYQVTTGSIQFNPTTGWQLHAHGEGQTVQVLPSTVVTTWVIFLHYAVNDQRRSLIIAKDALSTKDFRRLIVALKVSAKTALS